LLNLTYTTRWREKGLWPASYDQLLGELIQRHGKSSGTRQMIQVLGLVRPTAISGCARRSNKP
jgi:hypothetical protein